MQNALFSKLSQIELKLQNPQSCEQEIGFSTISHNRSEQKSLLQSGQVPMCSNNEHNPSLQVRLLGKMQSRQNAGCSEMSHIPSRLHPKQS